MLKKLKEGDILQPINPEYGSMTYRVLRVYKSDFIKGKDRVRLDLVTTDGFSRLYNMTYHWWKSNSRKVKRG